MKLYQSCAHLDADHRNMTIVSTTRAGNLKIETYSVYSQDTTYTYYVTPNHKLGIDALTDYSDDTNLYNLMGYAREYAYKTVRNNA